VEEASLIGALKYTKSIIEWPVSITSQPILYIITVGSTFWFVKLGSPVLHVATIPCFAPRSSSSNLVTRAYTRTNYEWSSRARGRSFFTIFMTLACRAFTQHQVQATTIMSRLTLAALGVIVAFIGAATATADIKQQLLSLRGGDINFSPQNAAKSAAIISLAAGSASALIPASSLIVMGMPSTPPLQASMRRLGTSLLSFGLLDYFIMFKDYTPEKAIGISCVPWIADFITLILMDDEDKKGRPMKAEYLGLLFNLLTSFAAFTEAQYTGAILKLNAGWLLAFGVFFKYAPEPDKFSAKTDEAFGCLNAFLGSCLLGLGLCEEALACDVGILKAMACGSCLFAIGGIATLCVEKESDELNVPKFPRFAWILIFGGIAASAFLGSNSS